MRIRRLVLERYGPFSGTEMAFPETARLHVVLGPNEAGKTTALAAFGDFLFGFHERSGDKAFGYDQRELRVGAEIAGRDGTTMVLVRRKGRQNTLLGPDGTPAGDGALDRLRGTADRRLFETMFGLTGDRLRKGGAAMLQERGSLTETLAQAGAGLEGIGPLLRALEAEARALYTPRRSATLPFYAAETAYKEATRIATQASLKAETWQSLRRQLGDAETALETARGRHEELRREQSRLSRLLRTLPVLQALREAEAELAGLADAARLGADAAARRVEAVRQQASAGQSLHEVHRRLADIAGQIEALPAPADVLQRREEIEALRAELAVRRKEQLDLPRVRQDLHRAEAAVAEAARQLGLDLDPVEAVAALPPAMAQERAQALIRGAGGVAQQVTSARQACTRIDPKLAEAREALVALPPPAETGPLRQALVAIRRQGDVEAALDEARHAREAAEREAASALAALPLWSAGVAALADAPMPGEATIRRLETALQAGADACRAQEEEIRRLEATLAQEQRGLADLSRGGVLPTAEAIGAARRERDAAWRRFRAAALGEMPAPDAAMAGHVEHLIAQADALSDRRTEVGERVVRYEAGEARCRDLVAQREAAVTALDAARQGQAAAEAAWCEAWQPALLTPLPPAEMRAWLAQRDSVLERWRQADAARRHEQGRRDALDRIARTLRNLLPEAPELGAAALLAHAEATLETMEAASRRHRDASEALARLTEEHGRVARDREEAEAQQAEWKQHWSEALAALHVPADATPEAGERALGHWSAIRAEAKELATQRRRVAEMEASIAAFDRAARACVEAVAPDLAGADAFAAAATLHARLAEALEIERRRRELEASLTTEQAAERKAADGVRRAGEVLTGLRAEARLPAEAPDEALEAAISRAGWRDALEASIGKLHEPLREVGDGRAADALVAEAAGADPDAIRAALDAAAEEQRAIVEQLGLLGEERQKAETHLADAEAGGGAAAAEQARRDAVATMAEAARDYARLRVAEVLLRRGLERYRQQQQDPLLRRAGAHFAALTAGRYAGLLASFDERDRAVLAARLASGGELPVEALSEGTRDQLFLALRVAAIEQYAAAAEPLPFIGDDLLVHFDDARAAAGLRLLATLGQTTQAILFTHHDHLAALAEAVEGVAVHRLPAPA